MPYSLITLIIIFGHLFKFYHTYLLSVLKLLRKKEALGEISETVSESVLLFGNSSKNKVDCNQKNLF